MIPKVSTACKNLTKVCMEIRRSPAPRKAYAARWLADLARIAVQMHESIEFKTFERGEGVVRCDVVVLFVLRLA